jgi:hypothetical protein
MENQLLSTHQHSTLSTMYWLGGSVDNVDMLSVDKFAKTDSIGALSDNAPSGTQRDGGADGTGGTLCNTAALALH